MACGLNCSAACGIFLDQESNPCFLYWQVDSSPLSHQRSPRGVLLKFNFKPFPGLKLNSASCNPLFIPIKSTKVQQKKKNLLEDLLQNRESCESVIMSAKGWCHLHFFLISFSAYRIYLSWTFLSLFSLWFPPPCLSSPIRIKVLLKCHKAP